MLKDRVYCCISCRRWFKRSRELCICVCPPPQFIACGCHCGDEKLTPVRYGDGTPYMEENDEGA